MREIGRFFSGFASRNGLPVAIYLLVAVSIWIFVLVVLPQLTMFDFSFRHNLPPPKIGGPEDVHTLEQYRYFLMGNEITGGGVTSFPSIQWRQVPFIPDSHRSRARWHSGAPFSSRARFIGGDAVATSAAPMVHPRPT